MTGFNLITLAPRDAESLLYAIDGSLKVQHRSQFFLWAQGGLQGPLPHETLVCAWGEIEDARYKYEVYSRAVLDERLARWFGDPVDGLVMRLVVEWRRRQRQPCIYTTGAHDGDGVAGLDGAGNCPPALAAELRRRGLHRVIAHGVRLSDGTGSFFVFVNGPPKCTPHDAYLVEILLPHLHSTVYRVAEADGDGGEDQAATTQLLSDREAQVLGWVREGKTNQEIALILDLSPLTVKNHIQKVLRKLQVSNRAQAVARAIATRLLDRRGGAG